MSGPGKVGMGTVVNRVKSGLDRLDESSGLLKGLDPGIVGTNGRQMLIEFGGTEYNKDLTVSYGPPTKIGRHKGRVMMLYYTDYNNNGRCDRRDWLAVDFIKTNSELHWHRRRVDKRFIKEYGELINDILAVAKSERTYFKSSNPTIKQAKCKLTKKGTHEEFYGWFNIAPEIKLDKPVPKWIRELKGNIFPEVDLPADRYDKIKNKGIKTTEDNRVFYVPDIFVAPEMCNLSVINKYYRLLFKSGSFYLSEPRPISAKDHSIKRDELNVWFGFTPHNIGALPYSMKHATIEYDITLGGKLLFNMHHHDLHR